MRLCDDSADNKYSVADTIPLTFHLPPFTFPIVPLSHCPIVPLKTKESAEG